MLTELILAPLHQGKLIPSYSHGHVVDYVENELSNNATMLTYVEFRGGTEAFCHIMTFRRPLGTLPVRHLFVLKWLRMMEYSGLLPDMVKEGYEKYISQFYCAILNADGKASVTFEATRQGGAWFEENRLMLQQKCLDYYTPNFDDAFLEANEHMNDYMRVWPDTPMADFFRRHLVGGSSGWASSR